MTTKPNTIPANNRCGTCWHMRIQKGAHVGRCLLRQETVHETMPNCELYKNRAREAKRRPRGERPDRTRKALNAQRRAQSPLSPDAPIAPDGQCTLMDIVSCQGMLDR